MAKVSVIIPVYNVEKYLERCLESLVNQTLKDIEIICVNDGSTDNSLKILEEFAKKDERIKIFNRENKGQSAARNFGIEHANGEYIGYVDSDDWVDLDFYEKLYNAAVKYDADIVAADFVRKNDKKHKIRLNLKSEKVYTGIEEKIEVCHAIKEGCIWNKIYAKNILENLKFVEGMYFEDGLFTLKALYNSNKLVTVLNTFYYYFVNSTSTVKKMNRKKLNDKILCRQQMMRFIKEKNIKIPDGSFWIVKKAYKIFGRSYLTVMESIKSKKYLLFNAIPIWLVK